MNNYRSKKSKFIYNEFKPKTKNNLIEMFWSFDLETGDSKNLTMRLLPNYSPVIIYCCDRKTNTRRLLVSGPLTQNIIFAASTDCIAFGASLKLFAYNKISHYPLLNLKNELIPFSKAFSTPLERQILGSMKKETDIYSFEIILTRLLQQIKIADSNPDVSLSEVSKIIFSSEGTVKLNEVYNTLSSGRRQFVRNFTSATGLTPKQFNRITRIKSLTRKLMLNHETQADQMFEGGFFDQSHYCSEFKKLTGSYPAQFESTQKRIKYENLITIDDDTFLQ